MRTKLSRLLEEKGEVLHSVAPDVTVAAAVGCMNEARVGAVLVMDPDGGRLLGIFTERDVLVRVVGAGRVTVGTRVEEVMTSEVLTVGPDMTVEQAMKVCTERRCRHLPVVDEGKVLGMVSSGDLTRWVSRHLEDEVRDLHSYITGGYPSPEG